MKKRYNTNEALFKCIYDIISRILSYKNVTILICRSEVPGYRDVFVRSIDNTARNYRDTETATYMLNPELDITKIIKNILYKLVNTLDIHMVDWYRNPKLRHFEYNDRSLFSSYEIQTNEYKLDGLQFIITQNRNCESAKPVEIKHSLNFNSNELDQFLHYNIPIKDTTPPLPTVLCVVSTDIQLGYSATPDITTYNKYDIHTTIDTNKMTSNVHIHADKEIASEDNINLNAPINIPHYTELTEKLNAYDIRITRPIIVIVNLLTEVTKIAINELKEYCNGNA